MTTTITEAPPYTWISFGRKLIGQTQQQLAEALAEITGDHWTQGIVNNLERGKKHFTVETLIAISEIQSLPIDFYLHGLSNLPSDFVLNEHKPG